MIVLKICCNLKVKKISSCNESKNQEKRLENQLIYSNMHTRNSEAQYSTKENTGHRGYIILEERYFAFPINFYTSD